MCIQYYRNKFLRKTLALTTSMNSALFHLKNIYSLWPTELIYEWAWVCSFTQWGHIWFVSSCYSCPKYSQAYLFLNVGPSHTLQNISLGVILVGSQHDQRILLWAYSWVCPRRADVVWGPGLCLLFQAPELSFGCPHPTLPYPAGVVNKWLQTNLFYLCCDLEQVT